MAYASWSVVYGETPSASKWNILGTNDASFNDGTGIAVSAITPEKLFTGTGTSWVWQSWTPTWTNLTVGNGTVVARYVQHGKTVIAEVGLTFGSGTSITGTGVKISFPVTPASRYSSASRINHGFGVALDAGTATYPMILEDSGSTSNVEMRAQGAGGTYLTGASITSTAPFTWTTSDGIFVKFVYEAA